MISESELPTRHDDRSLACPRFELRLLGRFELFDRSASALVQIASKRAKALIALLAAAPDLKMSRPQLATLLWNDRSEEQTRQSLRQLLSDIRRVPGLATLVTLDEERGVRLNGAVVEIDYLALKSASIEQDVDAVDEIVARYRGPFAADVEIGESEFNDWIRNQREQTANLTIFLLNHVVKHYALARRHEEALARATVLFALSPLREETHRLIIAQEAIVAGRASAMQSFERFRVLLRDELAVKPEPATVQLIETLRNLPPMPVTETAQTRHTARPGHVADPAVNPVDANRRRQRHVIRNWRVYAAGLAAMLVVVIGATYAGIPRPETGDPASSSRRDPSGLVSITILPFVDTPDDLITDQARDSLYQKTLLAFLKVANVNLLSLVDADEKSGARKRSPPGTGYVVKTFLTADSGSLRADLRLSDASTNTLVSSIAIVTDDTAEDRFARDFFGKTLAEITVHQARLLSAENPESIGASLWRARAAQIRTRVSSDSTSVAIGLYNSVLAKEPHNLVALTSLAGCLVLRVARNESQTRADDLSRIAELVSVAKPLAPNSSEVAFQEGMLNKLLGKFEQASILFQRVLQIDPAHRNASVQYAHVMMFVGRIPEAWELMEATATNLLTDLMAAETAYMAGETALVAGHVDKAIDYLSVAVSGNPTIGRIHALYASALELAGRNDEARDAARDARQLNAAYTPDIMAKRGGKTADVKYVDARDRFVEAFRAARESALIQ